MSHTPRPWHIHRHGYESMYQAWEFIESEYGSPIAGIWDPTGTSEQFANARLIAAAPDLLEALESILPFLVGGEAIVASAAIRKAKGGA